MRLVLAQLIKIINFQINFLNLLRSEDEKQPNCSVRRKECSWSHPFRVVSDRHGECGQGKGHLHEGIQHPQESYKESGEANGHRWQEVQHNPFPSRQCFHDSTHSQRHQHLLNVWILARAGNWRHSYIHKAISSWFRTEKEAIAQDGKASCPQIRSGVRYWFYSPSINPALV